METTTEKKVEVTVRKDSAATYYISHPEFSYGIFCFNDKGDLFVNSDWGMYGYAWRSYGDDFKAFLAQTNPEYVFTKFDTNSHYSYRKGIPKHCQKPVTELLRAFINVLKDELKG
jgi:hypothetical protein